MTWRNADALVNGDVPDESAQDLWVWIRPDLHWTPEDAAPRRVAALLADQPAAASIRPESLLAGLRSGRIRGNFEQARLSPAQLQALELRLAGRRSREIASALRCSASTARTHVAAALAKVSIVAVIVDSTGGRGLSIDEPETMGS